MEFFIIILVISFILTFIIFAPLFLMYIYVIPFILYLDDKSLEDLLKFDNSNFSNEFILICIAYKDFIKISLLATKCYLCWLTFRRPKNPTRLFNFKFSFFSTLNSFNESNFDAKTDEFFNKLNNKFDNFNAKMEKRIERQLARNERDKARLKAIFSQKHKTHKK